MQNESNEPISIDRIRLEAELSIYENQRIELIEECHQLERLILTKYPYHLAEGEAMIGFNVLLVKLLKNELSTANVKKLVEQIVALRNAFLHNQYPKSDLFRDEIKFYNATEGIEEKLGLGIAQQLLTLGKQKCDQLSQVIQKN